MRFVATARVAVDVDPASVVGPALSVDPDLVARSASETLARALGDRFIEVTEVHATPRSVWWVRRRGRLKGRIGVVHRVEDGRVSYGYRGRSSLYNATVAWWLDNFALEAVGAVDHQGRTTR